MHGSLIIAARQTIVENTVPYVILVDFSKLAFFLKNKGPMELSTVRMRTRFLRESFMTRYKPVFFRPTSVII